ncbi:MAG: ACT domain-containing protein [Peptoniphilaceae bacterium]|nr:ACT domain-containing protein [Peptoniphilaceae bacterium]MDY6085770.1 ACT domain-containing protein [Peptoniphilaceae bacterium]
MRAVITVVGKNRIGIVAGIAKQCADNDMDILKLEQTILDGIFTMMILVDLAAVQKDLTELQEEMRLYGESVGLEVRMRHEDTYNVMHNVDIKR